jgi:indole-3-glycerol phosphate synthase
MGTVEKLISGIARMQKAGAHCFLVGESLLKQKDVKTAVAALNQ